VLKVKHDGCMCHVENFVVGKPKKAFSDEECCQGKMVSDVVDDGQIPGDGLGVCGFDSSLFL